MEKRVQKIISEAGISSRRKAEEFILQSRVSVNDKVISLGDKADLDKDVIKLDGIVVRPEKKVYFAFNKPENLISSMDDNGQSIFGYVKRRYPKLRHMRVFHVGRLDFKTRGLMFLTNDGDFANYVMHPSNNVMKTYLVTTEPEMSNDDVEKINLGFDVKGDLFKAICKKYKNGVIKIILGYGKKRIIRRGISQLGYDVVDLLRVKIGEVHLGNLEPGAIRKLTDSELKILRYSRGKTYLRKKHSFNYEIKSKEFKKKGNFFRSKKGNHKNFEFKDYDRAFGNKKTFGKSYLSDNRSFSKKNDFRSFERKSSDKYSNKPSGFDSRRQFSNDRKNDNQFSFGRSRRKRDLKFKQNRSDSKLLYRGSDRSGTFNFKYNKFFNEDNQKRLISKNHDRKLRNSSEDVTFCESKFYKRLFSDNPSHRGRDYKRHDDKRRLTNEDRPKRSFKGRRNFSDKRYSGRKISDKNRDFRSRDHNRDFSKVGKIRDDGRSKRKYGSKRSSVRY